MMQLAEFVTSSLVQIFDGISGAKEQAEKHGFTVNPHITNFAGVQVDRETKTPVREVEFDIAVTAGTDKATGGGGGIRVLSLDFGAKHETGTTNTTVSRIRFSVPLGFPGTAFQPEDEKTLRELKEQAGE